MHKNYPACVRMPLTSSHCTSEAFTAGSSSSCLLSPKTPHPSHLTSAKVQGKCPRCPIGSTPRERLVTAAVAVTIICEKSLPLPDCTQREIREEISDGLPCPAQEGSWHLPAQLKAESRAMVHVIYPTTHS